FPIFLASSSSFGLDTPNTFLARMTNRAMPATFFFSPRRFNSATALAAVHFASARANLLLRLVSRVINSIRERNCHSERSEESAFLPNVENKSRFLGPRAAHGPRNDTMGCDI